MLELKFYHLFLIHALLQFCFQNQITSTSINSIRRQLGLKIKETYFINLRKPIIVTLTISGIEHYNKKQLGEGRGCLTYIPYHRSLPKKVQPGTWR